jgi:glycerol-3-phosphate acyltransferase PlsY
MSMIDSKNLLSEDLALPASATTEYSTNELHFETGLDAFGTTLANPNIGHGTPVYFNFVITTSAATASGNPTLTLNLVGATTTAPTTVIQMICSAVADTTLTAGYKISVALQDFPEWPVYLRLQVIANDAGFDVGKYSAWLSDCPLSDY